MLQAAQTTSRPPSTLAGGLPALASPALASTTLTRARSLTSTSFVSAGAVQPISRREIIANAQQCMGVPYVWGGTTSAGLDCSAFVSKAWGVSRHTTDNLAEIARRIDKNELQQGDALNLTTGRDSDGAGHVRLFDRWANAEKTQMWVYEETPPRAVHHVINWDPSYQPMRRLNVTDGISSGYV